MLLLNDLKNRLALSHYFTFHNINYLKFKNQIFKLLYVPIKVN